MRAPKAPEYYLPTESPEDVSPINSPPRPPRSSGQLPRQKTTHQGDRLRPPRVEARVEGNYRLHIYGGASSPSPGLKQASTTPLMKLKVQLHLPTPSSEPCIAVYTPPIFLFLTNMVENDHFPNPRAFDRMNLPKNNLDSLSLARARLPRNHDGLVRSLPAVSHAHLSIRQLQ